MQINVNTNPSADVKPFCLPININKNKKVNRDQMIFQKLKAYK